MHGISGSVSAPSNGGNGAPAAATLPRHHLSSSRSNSLSSSSVVTIKRTGSLSPSGKGARSQSPVEMSLIALRLGRDPISQEHKRRKSVAVDPAEHGASDGLNNLNRWSHSTNSSAASTGNTRRSRASSGAALQWTSQQFSPQARSKAGHEQQSPRPSPHRRATPSHSVSQRRLYSPEPSPHHLRRKASRPEFANSITALPPLHTTPALTDPNDTESPSTIQTITTPSTQSSYGPDYFQNDTVSPRNTAKNKRPLVVRHHTAPISALNKPRMTSPESAPEHVRRSTAFEAHEHHGSKQSAAVESSGHKRSRTREGKERDKKAMLSKALQKANTAVLLDNAQNFEGALDAYSDACFLLQQVMDQSSGADDKRKLDAIRVTYTNRIEELRQLEIIRPSTADAKDLPARPMSDESFGMSSPDVVVSPIDDGVRDSAVFEEATAVNVPMLTYSARSRESFFTPTMQALEGSSRHELADRREESTSEPTGLDQKRSHAANRENEDEDDQDDEETHARKPQTLHISPLHDNKYMPAPLSPRKPLSPKLKPAAEEAWQQGPELEDDPEHETPRPTADSIENSVSWLDTIDESDSCASSVHSMSSLSGVRRKHLRGASGGTDLDFDSAFDAAVEAAYYEGLEPDMEARKRNTAYKHAAKESVVVPSPDIKEVLSPTDDLHSSSNAEPELDDDEEERLLDEITNDYAQGFDFDLSSKSALPRQSDSSGYSGSTWQSSQASVDRNTAATSLSTVAEDALGSPLLNSVVDAPSSVTPVRADPPPPPTPAPTTALPRPPSTSGNRLSTVRNRRLSGVANTKQLKIETSAKPEGRKRASTFHQSPSSRVGEEADQRDMSIGKEVKLGGTLEPTLSDVQHEHILTSPPSLDMHSATSEAGRSMAATVSEIEQRHSLDDSPKELRSKTSRPNLFRKNKSSASLRDHAVLLSSPEDLAPSAMTPMSSTFMTLSSKRAQDPLSQQRAILPSSDYSGASGAHFACLFDTSLVAVQAPTSPRSPTSSTSPMGLEPCPESSLLRPFWLMRIIASTLTHPKGGFLTTRLFVPREVWHTRNVKLKSIEDKVANCDLLTAALGRLAEVDTYDADALMEELQGFEEVMERVQASLAKKLGSEVGVHGLAGFFRDAYGGATFSASNGQGVDAVTGAEKAARSKEGKGYLNSWRKLRSKSSGTPLSTAQARPDGRDPPSMSSVPMTSFIPVERRGQKKEGRNLAFEGPNKEYMGSVARLFEGAQVLDQIARQVEDPGLKHSSPTHVGLELSVRHAAEFFAFYICRFVLADLGTLIDKFVKRGTEWVLA